MKKLFFNTCFAAIILFQSSILGLNTNDTNMNVSGTVHKVNSISVIDHAIDETHLKHTLIYEFSNNNINGYALLISLANKHAIISVQTAPSELGFWGLDTIFFKKLTHKDASQSFRAQLKNVTKATYKARFKIKIATKSPISPKDLYSLLAININEF
jgi:hypothetical protein